MSLNDDALNILDTIETSNKPSTVPNKISHKFDLAEAMILKYSKGFTYDDLGIHYDMSRDTIHSRFKAFKGALDDKEFNGNFDALETKLCRLGKLKHLVNISHDDTVKNASANNSAYVVGQLNTVQALAEGKPTQIIDINQIDKEILELQIKIEAKVKRELSTGK